MSFVFQSPIPLPATSRAAWAPLTARRVDAVVGRTKCSGSRRASENPALPDARMGSAGNLFARKRIHHAVEMFGSCMMIIAFLALAILA